MFTSRPGELPEQKISAKDSQLAQTSFPSSAKTAVVKALRAIAELIKRPDSNPFELISAESEAARIRGVDGLEVLASHRAINYLLDTIKIEPESSVGAAAAWALAALAVKLPQHRDEIATALIGFIRAQHAIGNNNTSLDCGYNALKHVVGQSDDIGFHEIVFRDLVNVLDRGSPSLRKSKERDLAHIVFVCGELRDCLSADFLADLLLKSRDPVTQTYICESITRRPCDEKLHQALLSYLKHLELINLCEGTVWSALAERANLALEKYY